MFDQQNIVLFRSFYTETMEASSENWINYNSLACQEILAVKSWETCDDSFLQRVYFYYCFDVGSLRHLNNGQYLRSILGLDLAILFPDKL